MALARGRIVVVDDDREMRALLLDFLSSRGFRVFHFGSAPDALAALGEQGGLRRSDAEGEIDLIISDIRMPQMDGLEFTRQVKTLRPEIPVMLITAFGSVETAIEAMRSGAYHYLVKPFKLAEVEVQLERALEHRKLQQENTSLREGMKDSWSYRGVIGKSTAMRGVFDLVGRVSQATANVLVTGESGTGKEMIARAIHEAGPRANQPFVAINCTAIPDTLLESELFGHAKGSFTGAIQRKKGLFEEAEGGTLFLDEIGDLEVSLQAKLLRVIQERKVRAVGDTVSRDVNVRIIAATHKDLKKAIREGRFREDLFYRLSVIPIALPALRERPEDIPVLAEHFLRKYASANGAKIQGFTPAALAKLASARWEGNVRELENVIERAVVLAASDRIDASDLPTLESRSPDEFFLNATQDFPTVEQLEKRYIQVVLEKTGGRKDKAAQILGMNRRTLYRKEREYGLIPQDSPEEESISADEADSEA